MDASAHSHGSPSGAPGIPDPLPFEIDDSRTNLAVNRLQGSIDKQLSSGNQITKKIRGDTRSRFNSLLDEQKMQAKDRGQYLSKRRENYAFQMAVHGGDLMSLVQTEQDKKTTDSQDFDGIEVKTPANPKQNMKIRTNFSMQFWKDRNVGEDAIIDKLKKKEFVSLGLYEVAGTTATALPTGSAAHEFTDDQAKAFAKILRLRFLRGTAALGHTSESNVQAFLALVKKNPKYAAALEGGGHHGDTDKLKDKQTLSVLVLENLGKLEYKAFDQDFGAADKEFKNISHDLENAEASPTVAFKSNYFTKNLRLADSAAALALINPTSGRTNLDAKIDKAETKQGEIEEAVKYYQKLKLILDAVYSKDSVNSLKSPIFRSLIDFSVTPPVIKDSALNKKVNLVTLKQELVQSLDLKEPSEYADEIKHAKEHEKEAAESKPEGAQAIIEVYKAEFKSQGLSDDEATRNACEQFFMRELSGDENDIIEATIEEICGRRLTVTSGLFEGAKAILKIPFKGTDEAKIVSVAESRKIGLPRGEGNTNLSFSSQLFNGITRTVYGTLVAPAVASALYAMGLTAAGAVTAPFSIPALIAGGSYAAVRALSSYSDNGLERFIGNRRWGILWPKWGARPAYGMLENKPDKLQMLYNGYLEKMSGTNPQLNNTWYVQGQMKEVGRMLLRSTARQAGYEMYKRSLTSGDWKSFNNANKREAVMLLMQKSLINGFTVETASKSVVDGSKAVIEESSRKSNWLFDWLYKKN